MFDLYKMIVLPLLRRAAEVSTVFIITMSVADEMGIRSYKDKNIIYAGIECGAPKNIETNRSYRVRFLTCTKLGHVVVFSCFWFWTPGPEV